MYLRAGDGTAAFNANATFVPQQGLTGTGTSFATASDPTVFLRHQNYLLYAQKNDGTAGFAADASFTAQGALG